MATSLKSSTADNLLNTKQSDKLVTATIGTRRLNKPLDLEIDTTSPTQAISPSSSNSKTNAFFHVSPDPLSIPRPPPSLSRKISIRQSVPPTATPASPITTTTTNVAPASPLSKDMEEVTLSEPAMLDEANSDNSFMESNNFANRLRNLIARQHSISPSSAYSTEKDKVHDDDHLLSPSPTTPVDLDFTELPTPLPTQSSGSNSSAPDTQFLLPLPPAATVRNSVKLVSVEEADDDVDSEVVGQIVGQYKVHRLLGVGAFSRVYLVDKTDAAQKTCYFAMKTIQKGKLLDDPRVRTTIDREINILKDIDHPNIIHFEDTFETEDRMCIIIDYIEGGELFDFVQKMHRQLQATRQNVDEVLVKNLFRQLLNAVSWLHDHNIVHRDLKLENILIHKKNKTVDSAHDAVVTTAAEADDIVLKITDFGLARTVDPESPYLVTRCGSEEYAAPEIIQQKSYDGRKTDTWALGIILYSLLVGYLPFRYDRRKKERVSQLFYRIVRADIKWPQQQAGDLDFCGSISDEAKFVVQTILERDPEKRISINDIEKLPWFNSKSF